MPWGSVLVNGGMSAAKASCARADSPAHAATAAGFRSTSRQVVLPAARTRGAASALAPGRRPRPPAYFSLARIWRADVAAAMRAAVLREMGKPSHRAMRAAPAAGRARSRS